jgi:hypothetical protein
MTKLEKLKADWDAARDAAVAANTAYDACVYRNANRSGRGSYFAAAARDAARAVADVAWDAYCDELKKHERTLMTNLMSKLKTKMKKLKVDWNAHLHGSASTLSELVAYQAATDDYGDAVDAYGDAVDAYGDAVDAQWAALKADWAASAAHRAEQKKTREEQTND